jgi:hypothetical protein
VTSAADILRQAAELQSCVRNPLKANPWSCLWVVIGDWNWCRPTVCAKALVTMEMVDDIMLWERRSDLSVDVAVLVLCLAAAIAEDA